MIDRLRMRALVAFHHGGRQYDTGDVFEVYPVEAAALRYQAKAEFLPNDTELEPEPPKRRYRRRDLHAEDA